ncbi:MAG: vitamin K epoxide reductase family protein [Candidatus Woesearchaeota archaeon]|nr:vitamin K epoxide reductase family protein [Candidatus Woesearchaeota archaeon]
MIIFLYLLAALGFLLSAYALRSLYKSYHPFCHISPSVSCTKAFFSSSGKLFFGIPNSGIGLFFYAGVYILTLLKLFDYILYAAVVSFIGTLYLMYVSYIKMKNFCIVCTMMYVVNILLLIISYQLA